MNNKDFNNIINNIQEKIGEETTSLIADDLATLTTDNLTMNNEIENQNKKITKLETDKENLIQTNGNLLQQVVMGQEEKPKIQDDDDEKPKKFNFYSAFDEKGKFKK